MQALEVKKEYSKVKRIEGWFSIESALIIGLIDKIQKDNNIEGNIFEIGVLYGKSSLFLAKLLNLDKENIEYCDNFLSSEGSPELERKDKFHKNINDFIEQNGNMNYKVYQCSSQDLDSEMIGNGYRLFHIDGCHDMKFAYHDIHLALQTMVDYGIIIVDDFMSSEWPSVSEAAILALKENPEYSPFLLAHNKLYICRNKYLSFYSSIFDDDSVQQEYSRGYLIKTENLLDSSMKIAYKPWTIKSNSLLRRIVRKLRATVS
jgi:hypothetical protein